MLAVVIETISQQPGSYVLWLHLPQPQNLTIGKLGTFTFPRGDYVYLGSARGPGGLRARLGRHLRGDGKIRWHIDYLRAAAKVRGFGYQVAAEASDHLPVECAWSQKLAPTSDARIVAPGFGSSDCQSGCTAHLIHFPAIDTEQITRQLNCEIRILEIE